MWGWTMPPETCFDILSQFYERGFRSVDTATNYPINKNPADFRRSETILQQWLQTHGVTDLQIIVKIGSINNLRTPEHNLSKSFILINLDQYAQKFGSNFTMLMPHWDNREDENEVLQTLEALDEARKQGLQIGLSGIRHPDIYKKLNESFQFDFHLQCKHNILQSDYERYKMFHGKRRFITYGINAGGLKLNPDEYRSDSSLKARGGNVETEHPIAAPLRQILTEANEAESRPKLLNMNQIGMLYAYHSPDVESILIGPSKWSQLESTLEFFGALQSFDYTDVYQRVRRLNC